MDALSFTETEARAIQEKADNQHNWTILGIKRSNVAEVVLYGDSEIFHKVKIQYVALDDESEKQKKVTTYLLVNSESVEEANARAKDHLNEMLVPYDITSVVLSPIVEVMEKVTPKPVLA